MIYIDTHAHIDQFPDLGNDLREAAAAGVDAILAVAVDLESSRKLLALTPQPSHPRIHLGLGVHPGMIKPGEVEPVLDLIREHHARLTAVGEIGLDFWYKWVRKDQEKKDEQRDVFRRHLALAKEFDLPAVIHTRGTWRQALEITREMAVTRGVFHWYSGPVDILEDILADGFYVSCSPSLAYSPQSRDAMAAAPLERILIETDSPVTYRPRDGEDEFDARPKDVARTLRALAELKELDPEVVLAQVNANARQLFGIESVS